MSSGQSIVQQWRDTQSSPYISPNLARAHHARKYAQYLKARAEGLEQSHRQVRERILRETPPADRQLVEHHLALWMEEEYHGTIVPLLHQAMQVEQTVDELLLSASSG
jgi:hypothetical protein